MATRPRRRTLSVAQQAFVLRGRFPEATLSLSRGQLRWTASLQPLPTSRPYVIRIVYRTGAFPIVRTLSELPGRPGESLPHTFKDGSLCLHEDRDWSPHMLIADSIVTWAAEWLVFYEIWEVTGEWYGGGVWPPVRSSC